MRWIVGFLLVGAAGLKAAQLIADPLVSATPPGGPVVLQLQVVAELAVGAMALSGVYWRQLRLVAAVLFAGFAGYSLYLAVSGATSCGCFGELKVHPWWTFALDLAVLMGLIASVARGVAHVPMAPRARGKLASTTAYVAVATCSVAALAWYAVHRNAQAASAGGEIVLLEPTEWIGEPLPLAESIDADLSQGEWIVLLHRYDCPKCIEATPHYERLAAVRRVALVEVPPYCAGAAESGLALHLRLTDDREWLVQTPVEIQIKDGVVLDASTELPAIAPTARSVIQKPRGYPSNLL